MTEGISHRCPPWCHECPDIEAIVRGQGREPDELDIMSHCMGGIEGGVESCLCSHEDPHLSRDTIARAQWFNAERTAERSIRAKVPDRVPVAALHRTRGGRGVNDDRFDTWGWPRWWDFRDEPVPASEAVRMRDGVTVRHHRYCPLCAEHPRRGFGPEVALGVRNYEHLQPPQTYWDCPACHTTWAE